MSRGFFTTGTTTDRSSHGYLTINFRSDDDCGADIAVFLRFVRIQMPLFVVVSLEKLITDRFFNSYHTTECLKTFISSLGALAANATILVLKGVFRMENL